MLLTIGKIGEGLSRGNVQTELVEQRLGAAGEFGLVDATHAARFASEEDVARYIEIIEQVEFLVHETDPETGGSDGIGDGHRIAVDPDLSRGGLEHAAQEIHQGGLSGAVFSDQADHLTGFDAEVDF